MRRATVLAALALGLPPPTPALAEAVVATRLIPARQIVTAADVTLVAARIPGAIDALDQALGQQTRVALTPGRPLRAEDLGPPIRVQRNQIVRLVFASGGLAIGTEGRALGEGAEGEAIDVLNLASRSRVSGRIGPDGSVHVGGME